MLHYENLCVFERRVRTTCMCSEDCVKVLAPAPYECTFSSSSGAAEQQQREQSEQSSKSRGESSTIDDNDDCEARCEDTTDRMQCEPCDDTAPPRGRRSDHDLILREHARDMFETQLQCSRIITADDGRQRHRRRKRGDG